MDRNPSPPRLSAEEIELIEGDKIGETVFSKKWALTTLMKLVQSLQSGQPNHDGSEEEGCKDKSIDETLDAELCELWDMSMNPDVAEFLEGVDATGILLDAILKSQTPRITEISVGILGNMACNHDVCARMMLNTRFLNIVTALLQDPDASVLVETTRLIHVCLSNEEVRAEWLMQFQDSEPFKYLVFILDNSLNTDLLSNAAHLVDKLLDYSNELLEACADETLVGAVSEALKQMRSQPMKLVETFLHILQLISTVEDGVQALVRCSSVVPLLCYFIAECGHDEGGIIVGHELPLTTSFSVLNVILLAEPLTVLRAMGNDTRIMKILMGVLGYSCKIHRKRTKSKMSISEADESKESALEVKGIGEQVKGTQAESTADGHSGVAQGRDETRLDNCQSHNSDGDAQIRNPKKLREVAEKVVGFEGNCDKKQVGSELSKNDAEKTSKVPCTEESEAADIHHQYFTVAVGLLTDIISESPNDPQCVSGMLSPHEKLMEKIVHYASRVTAYSESIHELVQSTLAIPELDSLHDKLSRMLLSAQGSEKI